MLLWWYMPPLSTLGSLTERRGRKTGRKAFGLRKGTLRLTVVEHAIDPKKVSGLPGHRYAHTPSAAAADTSTRSNLRHVMMLAQLAQVRVQLLDSLFVGLEKFRSGLGLLRHLQ